VILIGPHQLPASIFIPSEKLVGSSGMEWDTVVGCAMFRDLLERSARAHHYRPIDLTLTLGKSVADCDFKAL
jgi:hypothetical protein